MNELEKIMYEKKTENGDKSYTTTGNNLTDLLFMTPFFEKNIDQVKIGTSEGKVRVDGVNIVKKHAKSRGATTTRGMINQQTGIIDFPAAMDASKVMLVCPKCGKFTRIAHDKATDGSSVRKCRKCHEVID